MLDARARRVLAHAHGGALAPAAPARAQSRGRRRALGAGAGVGGPRRRSDEFVLGRRRALPVSGSADMTARAHASWESRVDETFLSDLRDVHKPVTLTLDAPTTGWREIARPQIHGPRRDVRGGAPRRRRRGGSAAREKADAKTDAATLAGGSVVFVSGADEKTPVRLRRARDAFRTLARSLPRSRDRGAQALEAARERAADASGGAELPQLGLSNKALRAPEAPSEPVPETPPAEPAERAERGRFGGRRRRRGGFRLRRSASARSRASTVWGGPGPHEQPAPARERAHQVARAQTPRRRHRGRAPPGRDHAGTCPSDPARAHDRGCGCAPRGRRHDSRARRGAAPRTPRSPSRTRRPTGFVLRPGGRRSGRRERGLGPRRRRRAEPAAAERGGDAHANGESTRDGDTFGSVTPAALSRPRRRRPWRRARCGRRRQAVRARRRRVVRGGAPFRRWWRPRARRASASAASIRVWDASKDWRPPGKLAGATLTVVARCTSRRRRARRRPRRPARPAFSALASSASGAEGSPAPAPEPRRRRGTGSRRPATCPRSAAARQQRRRGLSRGGGGRWPRASRRTPPAPYDVCKGARRAQRALRRGRRRDKRVKVWRVDDERSLRVDGPRLHDSRARRPRRHRRAPAALRSKAVGLEDGGVPRAGGAAGRAAVVPAKGAGVVWTVTRTRGGGPMKGGGGHAPTLHGPHPSH